MSDYRVVESPTLSPSCCLITKKAGVPCVDLSRDFDFDHQGRMYLSLSILRDLGKMAGLVDPDVIAGLEAELAEARARVEELDYELGRKENALAAIEVLETEGYRARKKPGRPPKAKEAVNA